MPEFTPSNPNTSLLQSTNYTLSFIRIPNFIYQVQTVNLPGFSTDSIERVTPFVNLHVPGTKVQFDTLNINYLVDQDLRAWEEIFNWITGYSFPENFEQYRTMMRTKEKLGGQYSDAVLTMNSNQNTPNMRIHFKDCFPISLASLNMDVTLNAETPMVSEASFRFNYYTIERI